MKIDDLRNRWIKDRNFNTLIQHENSKDVQFWTTSLTTTKDHYILNGWWIALQTKEPMVPEEIKIKHADLDGWYIVED